MAYYFQFDDHSVLFVGLTFRICDTDEDFQGKTQNNKTTLSLTGRAVYDTLVNHTNKLRSPNYRAFTFQSNDVSGDIVRHDLHFRFGGQIRFDNISEVHN